MTQWLKQSTAFTFQLGPFVDATDGVTPETALTIAATDVDLSKNGAAFADKNDATALTGTGDSQGWYDCVLNSTDTGTLGQLDVRCYVSGALPVWRTFAVVPANVWDSLFGADRLQVHADEITAGLITATAIATGAIDADAIADGAIDAGAIATGAITAAKFAAGAIDAAALAADAGAEIADAVWDEVLSGHNGAGSAGKIVSDTPAGVFLKDSAITSSVFVTGAIDANALGSDAVSEIQSGLATASALAIVDDFLDTEVAAIKAKTDNLPASPAAVGSPMTLATDAITAAVIATGAIDADAIAADAITASKIAANAITAAKFAAGAITATVIATNAIDADALAADAVDEILDEIVEGSTTLRQVMRLVLSVLGAISNGGGTTTVNFRDLANTRNRVAATVDSSGNRIAVTLDLT